MNPVIYIPKSKRLMEQLCEVLRYNHYSLKTEQACCYWVHPFRPMVRAWWANAASARHGRTGMRLMEGMRLRAKDVDFPQRKKLPHS